ncbi:transposase [Streptomyces lasalocidi]|uniref:Transposase n=1 Tax=Streptomyces lasalocidi TaxID=324833 RepID=A0A4U5W5K5_STRLS|nr:transposase [Streptomyces lasalocidi]
MVAGQQVINGMIVKIQAGITWRDLPERYGPRQRSPSASGATPWTACPPGLCSRSRPGQTRQVTSTGSCKSTPPSSAPTSTPPPPAEMGEAPAGRTGRSRPRPIPRRTDSQDPPRLRRQGPPSRPPDHGRTASRQHLRIGPAGQDSTYFLGPAQAGYAANLTVRSRPSRWSVTDIRPALLTATAASSNAASPVRRLSGHRHQI